MSAIIGQSVLYMKVTEALRAASPAALAELSKTYNIADFPHLLSLAVELSPYETVAWVSKLYLSKNRDVNEVDPKTGNTALHVAVASDRVPVVRDLLAIPSLDDTIRNNDGLTALDLASTPEMEHTIQQAENAYAQEMSVLLKRAFADRNLAALEQIYANPRVSQLLNINGTDPETGKTVLHDAAQANDLGLTRFIIAHGGDPLIRDKQTGKLPQDLTKSAEIGSLLSSTAKSRAILGRTGAQPGNLGDGAGNSSAAGGAAGNGVGAAPSMEGYLKKWTNLTSGYKLRWFSLRDGRLVYYKRPEDAKKRHAERGSIALRRAHVRLDSSEKNKFEVFDEQRNRWFLKAPHPADTNKWVWVLKEAITRCRDAEKRSRASKGAASAQGGAASAQGGAASAQGGAKTGRPVLGVATGGSAAAAASAPVSATSPLASAGPAHVSAGPASGPVSALGPAAPLASASTNTTSPSIPTSPNPSTTAVSIRRGPSGTSGSIPASPATHRRKQSTEDMFYNDLGLRDDDDDEDFSDLEADESDDIALSGPQISAESVIARLSAIKDLMMMLVPQVKDETLRDAITTVQASVDVLSSDIVTMQRQAAARLHRTRLEFERSEKNQRMWASNYRDLELQYEALEERTHKIKRQFMPEEEEDEFFDTWAKAPTKETIKEEPAEEGLEGVPTEKTSTAASTDAHSEVSNGKEAASVRDEEASDEPYKESEIDDNTAETAKAAEKDSGNTESAGATGAAGAGVGAVGAADAGESSNAETKSAAPPSAGPSETTEPAKSEDELLDPPAVRSPSTEAQHHACDAIVKEKTFLGYNRPPRTRLKLDADNRPRLSLWGILKNLIGKDMTKMTLPVTFNECTSLLQRSAEDMEYVDLLDRAAEAVDDPGLRMAYVAAFAASSYSSTINRVAKPFNPLLGETYEYARRDGGYRLFAEQVSHHPPIGALMAESKHWDFYGQSNVESKFYGRSFDINPLGLWYLNLRPDKGADVEEELYSFRKITSSVVGIMVGNPVVDNYGDMRITNHTTGVHATITYKARGWRGASAYKLQGKVLDRNGKELWTVAGQWNDKIYGMKSGSDERVLLWQAHARHRTPFNLTDFAITLNDINDDLKPWLAPTDTRLRPDQRAMEEGRYDDASDEKHRVEEKQRAARRERENAGEEYKPKWFELTRHPVTNLDYYRPINDYWGKRANKELAGCGDIF